MESLSEYLIMRNGKLFWAVPRIVMAFFLWNKDKRGFPAVM